MSTNTNPDILTNIGALEKLANQFFKSLPGDVGKDVSLQPASIQASPVNAEDLVQSVPAHPSPQFPADTSYTPPSLGGVGTSPSGVKNISNFPVSDIQGNVPVNHFATGQVPKSVAGSGISPSAFDNNSSFNIADPQTSLPDPHFSDGKIPSSVAGSGRQPSLQQKEATEELPYSSDYSFQEDLQKALSAFNTFIPVSQLPVSGFGGASYYFLQDKNSSQLFAPLAKVTNPTGKNNPAITGLQSPPFDANFIKKDFPILNERVNGRQLVWLDNAATTQKPQQVIDRISYFYEHENSNVHRAAHELAARATDAYEGAREK